MMAIQAMIFPSIVGMANLEYVGTLRDLIFSKFLMAYVSTNPSQRGWSSGGFSFTLPDVGG
jgi:hypothetical protein